MTDIDLAQTKHTPRVQFAFSRHALSLEGEIYPENAAAFFGPLIEGLEAYLARRDMDALRVTFNLRYMNSASTKMIFRLLGMLDRAGTDGRSVALEFQHDPEDEMMVEFAEDIAREYERIQVKLTHAA
jgi:hypothetical protein